MATTTTKATTPGLESIDRLEEKIKLLVNTIVRIKGDQKAELDFSLGINEPVMLMLVFAGAVALVSSVMAHAAKIAEENRHRSPVSGSTRRMLVDVDT